MSVTINTHTQFRTFKSKFSSVNGVNFFAQVPPVGEQGQDETDDFDPRRRSTAAEVALEELEEKYRSLLESVRVEKFNPKYISRYIISAERRRGASFTANEKKRIKEMAESNDPEVIRLLALELRIGVPRKIERDALASMGNLMLHREDDALRQFLRTPGKDPNLVAYVKTILMMSHVETWMDRYRRWKRRYGKLMRPLEMLIPDLDFGSGGGNQSEQEQPKESKAKKNLAKATAAKPVVQKEETVASQKPQKATLHSAASVPTMAFPTTAFTLGSESNAFGPIK